VTAYTMACQFGAMEPSLSNIAAVLDMEQRHITEGERRIRRQEEIVESLAAAGRVHQLQLAEDLLATYRTALSVSRRKLASLQPGSPPLTHATLSAFILSLQTLNKERDFTVKQLLVLLTVFMKRENRLTRNDLAVALESKGPSMTRSVDLLEQSGLVHRDVNPNDRREYLIRPTEKGADLVRSAFER
jgi:DNA-binding MarR family transcriptional regulator